MYPKPSIFTSPSLSLGMPEMSTSSHSDASNGRGLASHTLIVPPSQADTILVPSWLKATELISRLCALCFSALSSRDPVGSGEVLSFGLGEGWAG